MDVGWISSTLRNVTIQLSLISLSLSCPKLLSCYGRGCLCFNSVSEMHSFITAKCPGKEKSPLPSRGEKIGCPHRVLPSWTFVLQTTDLGKMELNCIGKIYGTHPPF